MEKLDLIIALLMLIIAFLARVLWLLRPIKASIRSKIEGKDLLLTIDKKK